MGLLPVPKATAGRLGSKTSARQTTGAGEGGGKQPRAKDLALIEAGAQDEDLAATPLAALLGDPLAREDEAVEEALDWWLESLPASGVTLAPEISLSRAGLLEVFRRGRLAVGSKGKVLQEEGDEVRYYYIVLQGRCRLRCRAPVQKSGALSSSMGTRKGGTRGLGASTTALKGTLKDGAEDGEEDVEAQMDSNGDGNGSAGCDLVGKGEAIGLLPGNSHSPYEVLCLERTVVLLLTSEDYSLALRPHHRELQAQAVKFLLENGVCPQATPFQLQRLAPFLRHRRVRRGGVLMKAGDFQRNVWILRGGACSLYAPPSEAYSSSAPAEGEDSEEEESEGDEAAEQEERLKLMRAMARRPREEAAAFENGQKVVLAQHARGPLAKSLRDTTLVAPTEGSTGAAASKPGPIHQRQNGAKKGMIATAKISAVGSVVGDEMLLHDNLRDQVASRCCSTVEVDEDATFYTADVTILRLLGSYIGADTISAKVQDKLSRHGSHATRGRKVAKELASEMRHLQRVENAKRERQQLRLPPSTGTPGLAELENVNDWLRVVFDHRKAPFDEKNQGSLSCLDGLEMTVATCKKGPGMEAMLKVFNDQTLLRDHRFEMRTLRRDPMRRRRASDTGNPMGATIPAEATLDDTSQLPNNRLQLAVADVVEEAPLEPIALDDEEEEEAGGGVFFQTEVDTGASPDRPPAPPAAARANPRAPEVSMQVSVAEMSLARFEGLSKESASMPRSSSVPVLPRLQAGGSAASSQHSFNSQDRLGLVESRSQAQFGTTFRRSGETKEPPKERNPAVVRAQKIMKAFSRAVPGKSIVVLTDKKAVRKSICSALVPAGGQLDICFSKSTSDLWKRMQDPKEQYHAVLLDLEKTELQVESLLTTIRGHPRYGKVPIIVLSGQRELPPMVQEHCSFVVFQPLAATTLREALLWCFDRKALAASGKYEVPASSMLASAEPQDKLADDWASMAVLAKPAPFGASVAISVGA